MMSNRARKRIDDTASNSFACDLAKWLWIMETYEQGGHAYHATMPTDGLVTFSRMMNEMKQIGFDTVYHRQQELGDRVRSLLGMKGFKSVAADGYGAPGVVVCYTDDPGIQNGSKFAELGLQIAAGVPLRCGEPDGFSTFRLGLFGLDKLNNIDAAVATLEKALDQVLA
jgi:aspartate aminotransferase-like enzyme